METYKLPFSFFETMKNCPQLNYYSYPEEKEKYLNKWRQKVVGLFTPFSKEEYKLYKTISKENQFYFRRLSLHYKDDGCLCVSCKKMREKTVFFLKNENKQNNFSQNLNVLHNIPENKDIQAQNGIYLRLFKEKFVFNYLLLKLDL